MTYGTESKGNEFVPEILLNHSHEEADTLILLHALTVNKDAELVIDSPDTDVFLLMIHMYSKLPIATSFLTGKSTQKKTIAIQPIFNKIGKKQASAILGFHAFTGSDMCGRFAGRTKDWCVKVFLLCDDQILNALASLGLSSPSPETCLHLERFVCLLYKSKMYSTVQDLRWYLYSNRGAEGESLPPTLGSLTPHILRAHYIAMIWAKAIESHPFLPSPVNFGWNYDATTKTFVPVRCLHTPAPEAILQLVKCSCKKGCKGNCSCRNNRIPCTEVCGCIGYSCCNKPVEVSETNIDEDETDEEYEI